MEQVTINSNLYERVYKEIKGYGKANKNHCPGIRLYSHYKEYLEAPIVDLGSGTGETVDFLNNNKLVAHGYDWIEPRSEFCDKQDITKNLDLSRNLTATSFDVIEHLTNNQVKNLFINMSACENQIFTIANTPSIVKLKNGKEVDLHINKKPFNVWRGIIVDYFDIVKEIEVRDYQRLYICKKKGNSKDYLKYMVETLRNEGYLVVEK